MTKLRPATASRYGSAFAKRSLSQRKPAAPVFTPPKTNADAANRLAAYRDALPRGEQINAEVNDLLEKLSDGEYGALRDAITFLQRHEHPPR
jgi:hypothetical protein